LSTKNNGLNKNKTPPSAQKGQVKNQPTKGQVIIRNNNKKGNKKHHQTYDILVTIDLVRNTYLVFFVVQSFSL